MPASVALPADMSGSTMFTLPSGMRRGSNTWDEIADSSRGSGRRSYSISTYESRRLMLVHRSGVHGFSHWSFIACCETEMATTL
jgi:hypothetical protein